MNVLSLFDGISCGQLALKRLGIKVDKYYASEIERSSIAITQKNFPDTIQLGDVTLLNEEKLKGLPKIDLILGGSPCFTKGTRIITSEGYKNIEDIKIGDEVLTHKNRYRKVLDIGGKYSSVCKIKAQGIIETTTTENHPYYIRSKNKKGLSEPIWKEVKEIKKGDYLGIPIIQKEENPYNLSEEQCWLLGRYVADGHIRKEKRKERKNGYYYQVIYSVGATKVEDFKNKVKDQHFSCYPHSKSVYRCVVSSKWLTEFIIKNNFGVGAENKNIPSVILNLPIELAQKFIEGYLSGDGNKRKENKYRFATVSYKLVVGMSLLCAKVYKTLNGINLIERTLTTVIEGRVVNQKPYYQSEINFIKPTKTLYKVENGYIWAPVKEVKKTKVIEKVYNMEVEEDNSYTANNAIVHNCQGFSRQGNHLNFEHKESRLFFEFIRILEYIKTNNNKEVKFLLENVEMKKEWERTITEYVGVDCLKINSKLFSAQNRPRYYWSNLKVDDVVDKEVKLLDIIDRDIDTADFIEKDGLLLDNSFSEKEIELISKVDSEVRIKQATKKGYIVAQNGDGINLSFPTSKTRRGRVTSQISGTLDKSCNVCVYHDGIIRKLGIEELERLQTLPVGYTEVVSNIKRRNAIGNGWTVDVIAHILKELK